MGSVYLAKDRSGATVAVKVMRSEAVSNPAMVIRFKQEIKISRELAHPYVIKILDGGVLVEKNILFLVMEFLPGKSLRQEFRQTRINNDRAILMMRHLAEALDYVHSKGIVHRDIKPDNILVLSPERTVLLDFGLAISDGVTRVSKTSEKPGTWRYMAPEQLKGATVDGRTDIYALGATFYWAVSGDGPYTYDEIVEIALGKRPEAPQLPHILNRNISRELSHIIMKCLSLAPGRRFASAKELVAALDDPVRFFKESSVPAHSGSVSKASVEKQPSGKGRRSTSTTNISRVSSSSSPTGNVRHKGGGRILLIGLTIVAAACMGFYFSFVNTHNDPLTTSQRKHPQRSADATASLLVRSSTFPDDRQLLDLAEGILDTYSKKSLPGGNDFHLKEIAENDRYRKTISLYYLSLFALDGGFYEKCFTYCVTMRNMWPYEELPLVIRPVLSLLTDSKAAFVHAFMLLPLTEHERFLMPLLNYSAVKGGRTRELTALFQKIHDEAETTQQKEISAVWYISSLVLIEQEDLSLTAGERSALIQRALTLCGECLKTPLSKHIIGDFTVHYTSLLSKTGFTTGRKQGFEFIENHLKDETLSSQTKMVLYNQVCPLLRPDDTITGRKVTQREQMNMLEFSKKALDSALALKTRRLPVIKLNRALACHYGDRPEEASKVCETIIRENPAFALSYTFVEAYTVILAGAGRFEEAITLLKDLLERDIDTGSMTAYEKEKIKKRISEYEGGSQIFDFRQKFLKPGEL